MKRRNQKLLLETKIKQLEMVLDPQFRQNLLSIIDQMIEHNLQRMNESDDIIEKETWKYEHSFDYHYGRTIGILTREFRYQFDNFYHRQASVEESAEIVKILDENSLKIRQALSYLKR